MLSSERESERWSERQWLCACSIAGSVSSEREDDEERTTTGNEWRWLRVVVVSVMSVGE